MALPVALGGLAGSGGALASIVAGVSSLAGAISRQPILAYFMVIGILILDGGISYYLYNKGVFGELFSFILAQLNVPIPVYSWQILMIVAILPLFLYAFKN